EWVAEILLTGIGEAGRGGELCADLCPRRSCGSQYENLAVLVGSFGWSWSPSDQIQVDRHGAATTARTWAGVAVSGSERPLREATVVSKPLSFHGRHFNRMSCLTARRREEPWSFT